MPQDQLTSLPEAIAPQVSGHDGVIRSRVLQGSVILLSSTGVVAGTNLLYNIVLARLLGTASFGHATAIYTLLMLTSAVTLSFQLVCSKYVARAADVSTKVIVYRRLLRRAWQVGAAIGVVLAVRSDFVTHYLNLPQRRDILLLAIAAAIYVPLGVRRGRMQGCYEFRQLAANVIIEAVIKFGVAVALVFYGLGVSGVIVAVALSILVAYLAAIPDSSYRVRSTRGSVASFGDGMQLGAFFIGQVIISNLDILLVKHYFEPNLAGIYAGVALVGRVVYMLSWSVVSSMFPVSASSSHERTGQFALRTGLLLVVSVTSVFVFLVWAAPSALWTLVLGKHFLLPLQSSFSSLLTLYAGMTAVYSVAVVLMTYEMSRRIGHASWLQLAASGLLAAGIVAFHHSLFQVILVQFVLMGALLLAVSAPLWKKAQSEPDDLRQFRTIYRLRRVQEEEVIAEFLKGEFYHREFDPYREEFRELVNMPVSDDPREAEMRRALLFRRRGKLWRELPKNTEWWEVELRAEDLPRLRVFPRNHWRRFAHESFYLLDTIGRVRLEIESSSRPDKFLEKLRSVKADLREGLVPNSVLLIGQDDFSAMTIIEGNHRVTAAMLLHPESVHERFRYYCGFSPNMRRCCWYQTDLVSLTHYAWNLIRNVFADGDDAVLRAMRAMQTSPKIEAEIEAG